VGRRSHRAVAGRAWRPMRRQPVGLSLSLTLMFTVAVKGSASERDSVGGNAGGDAVPSMSPRVCIVAFSCFGRVRHEESGGAREGVACRGLG